ncbi:MAG: lmo0937 family membrane protein [Candidatus Shapirobacteria bacterium]|nr:lmo0937 family membrane protein [Candidatus Shapirobacteria bacterium]
MLDIIVILLVISWLGGFSLHLGGGLIHLLLVIAVIVFIVRLLG